MTTAPSHVDHATTYRVFNFSAGPATLPEDVLQQAREDVLNIFDSGIGVMEHSHRGKAFDRVIDEAVADCRQLGDINDDYEILFLQGGATLQFTMAPMNFLKNTDTANYIDTGNWSTKAVKEAQRFANVNIAFSGKDGEYTHIPTNDELTHADTAVYTHYTSNNTIFGTQYRNPPTSDCLLFTDASSDIFSRPLPLENHGLVYAGAQKNLGPSGVVLVIIRKDLIERASDDLPPMLSYKALAEKGSRLNTPPTFGIYFMGQVFKWILRNGGLDAMESRNREKAQLIYDAIDQSGGFYTPHAEPASRSHMNVTFRAPSPELDQRFLEEAARHDLHNLKGYRTIGGMRASIYNAFPRKGCEVLASFMNDFAARHG